MTAEQLQAILDAHKDWLADPTTGKRAGLRGSDLRGSDLRGSDLRGSDLRGSNLSGSNLRYSNLRDSDLRYSNLSGSDLRYSNLSGSNLRYSNLRGSDLRGSNLSGSNLRYSNLRDSDLSYSNLRDSDLSYSNLRDSNLSDSDLRYSNLSGSDLRYSNLRGSNLSGSDGLPDPAEWLAANCRRTRGGILAYKTFGDQFTPPEPWVIEPGAEIAEVVNPLPTLDCACGVNVATLEWCRKTHPDSVAWELLVKWEWMIGAVVPFNTDGKFRVPRAKLVRIVENGGK